MALTRQLANQALLARRRCGAMKEVVVWPARRIVCDGAARYKVRTLG
jgi:hypothetical protein